MYTVGTVNQDITHGDFIASPVRTMSQRKQTIESAMGQHVTLADAFGAFYELHIDRVYGFLMRRVGEKETAQDLTSQTFMKALSGFQSFDERKGTFGVWILQIARNTLIDWYRTAKKHSPIEEAFFLSDNTDVAMEAHLKEDIRKIRTYMQSLLADQREILMMRVWDGLSYKDIARITGKSEASLKVAFSRAIAKLHKDIVLAFVVLIYQTFVR